MFFNKEFIYVCGLPIASSLLNKLILTLFLILGMLLWRFSLSTEIQLLSISRLFVAHVHLHMSQLFFYEAMYFLVKNMMILDIYYYAKSSYFCKVLKSGYIALARG